MGHLRSNPTVTVDAWTLLATFTLVVLGNAPGALIHGISSGLPIHPVQSGHSRDGLRADGDEDSVGRLHHEVQFQCLTPIDFAKLRAALMKLHWQLFHSSNDGIGRLVRSKEPNVEDEKEQIVAAGLEAVLWPVIKLKRHWL